MGNYISESTLPDPHDGKKKITSATICAEITARARFNLFTGLLFSFLMLLVMGLFAFLLAMNHSLTLLWTRVVQVVLVAAPVLTAMGCVVAYCRMLRQLKQGDCTVIVDTVERVVENDRVVRRWYRHRVYHVEHAMYLSVCGRVVIPLAWVNFTEEGDHFYVVVTKKNPRTPLLYYNAKSHELSE